MPVPPSDVALLTFVLVNVAVFGSAWRFAARRTTASRTQALLDAALLGYVVQYAAVGLTGVVGQLRWPVVAAVALVMAGALAVLAGKRKPHRVIDGRAERAAVVGLGVFAGVVAVGFAVFQANLPVMANDALTYHFPAAVQWIQQGRISLFQTWFFNPANAYSPLAGSTFIAWLMLPFGSDVLARFVQVPALLCTGLAVFRLARELGGRPAVAAAVAVAAVLCRPLFMAEMMGKDDLFVAFAFVAAVVSLAPARTAEPFAAARLGMAVGLLLALKYTALLAVPLLLLAADGPRWPIRTWATSLVIALVLAGPWYVRNGIVAGNPLFPLGLPGLHGLFTAARSDAFTSVARNVRLVIGGSYGVPAWTAGIAGLFWLVALGRRWVRDPVLRICCFGPPVGVVLFFWRSPFPEVRFLYPAILLLLSVAAASRRCMRWAVIALPLAALATLSIPGGWPVIGPVIGTALAVSVVVIFADRWAVIGPRYRRWAAVAIPSVLLMGYAYVQWGASCARYAESWAADDAGWAVSYRDDQSLWNAVTADVPADATIAYTHLYLVHPLYGPSLQRHVLYVPTRPGVRTLADLPWLGDRLSGEQIVQAADRATIANPDEAVWRNGLHRSGATHLVIGHATPGPAAEAVWVAADPEHFRCLYRGPGGDLYAIVR